MFEVRFAFSTTQAQSVRTSGRPEAVAEFAAEADALAHAGQPPKGAKMVMVRELGANRRTILRKRIGGR